MSKSYSEWRLNIVLVPKPEKSNVLRSLTKVDMQIPRRAREGDGVADAEHRSRPGAGDESHGGC